MSWTQWIDNRSFCLLCSMKSLMLFWCLPGVDCFKKWRGLVKIYITSDFVNMYSKNIYSYTRVFEYRFLRAKQPVETLNRACPMSRKRTMVLSQMQATGEIPDKKKTSTTQAQHTRIEDFSALLSGMNSYCSLSW